MCTLEIMYFKEYTRVFYLMFSPMSHSVCYFSESADVAAMQGPSPNGTSNGHLGQGGSSESEPHAHDTTMR